MTIWEQKFFDRVKAELDYAETALPEYENLLENVAAHVARRLSDWRRKNRKPKGGEK